MRQTRRSSITIFYHHCPSPSFITSTHHHFFLGGLDADPDQNRRFMGG
jgi:hypothetical protein